MDRIQAITAARETEKGMELYKQLGEFETLLAREYEESPKRESDFKVYQETLEHLYKNFVEKVSALPSQGKGRLTGSKRFFEEVVDEQPAEEDKPPQSLAKAMVKKDFNFEGSKDGFRAYYTPKFTADVVAKEVKVGAALTNVLPTPTVDRPVELVSLAALADIASYFGQIMMIMFYVSILQHMATTYLPISIQREQALSAIAEFASLVSGVATNVHTATQKFITIMRLLYDEPKPAAFDAKKTVTHLNFRTSHWVTQASEQLLRALGLTKK